MSFHAEKDETLSLTFSYMNIMQNVSLSIYRKSLNRYTVHRWRFKTEICSDETWWCIV